MQKISITHFSNEHSDWLRSLNFYKQEITILTTRLTEIGSKNTDGDVLKQVEHFENLFKVCSYNIDLLRVDINRNIEAVARQAAHAKAGYIDGELFVQHNQLKHRFKVEEMVIKDLRNDFNRFASEWL